jgi:hypothetical protein
LQQAPFLKFCGEAMKMIKNMSNTSVKDLVTFLRLFPDADVICCGDAGVVSVQCDVENVVRGPAF